MANPGAISTTLDTLHHVAVPVADVARAVAWYTEQFQCKVSYEDETWALLDFANLQLALVRPEKHPPHIAFVCENAEDHGELIQHRDGTRSIYVEDTEGNSIEVMAPGEPQP